MKLMLLGLKSDLRRRILAEAQKEPQLMSKLSE